MFKTGHIDRFWDDSFKQFNYVRQPITNHEVSDWERQGYDYVKSFTGCQYNQSNPMPDWVFKLDNMFGLTNQTYNFYRMKTLEIMPTHSDKYIRYMELFKVPSNKIWRALLLLEDWKSGHYLEVDGTGFTNWVAGDYVMWHDDTPHAAGNIGIEDRYTLQITGVEIG